MIQFCNGQYNISHIIQSHKLIIRYNAINFIYDIYYNMVYYNHDVI